MCPHPSSPLKSVIKTHSKTRCHAFVAAIRLDPIGQRIFQSVIFTLSDNSDDDDVALINENLENV